MFALRSGQGRRRRGATPTVFGLSFSAERFVLPRLLRRPVRVLARVGQGQFTPPPYAASMLTASFLAASSLYGAYVGGHFPAMVQAVTARSGFAVDQIKVSGNHETSEIDILDKLELDGWTSLVGFDPDEARERIASLPWVQGVAVRKVYPDTIEVRIDEREAFALWQQGSQLNVVEKDGAIIAPFTGGRQVALPLVIGHGAAPRAAAFIAKVEKYPELASRIKGYIRVGERRWDLRLENGITVKLPETGEDAAIADLVAMDRNDALLTRDIAAVDMRIADRLVVQLTPEAADSRNAALSARFKSYKPRPEKKI